MFLYLFGIRINTWLLVSGGLDIKTKGRPGTLALGFDILKTLGCLVSIAFMIMISQEKIVVGGSVLRLGLII
ncbi:Uncharacterised protein [Serratia quinivorans]|uniref:Uncharacterized protein n=1 Tax=Serratia quinivorans TaxID=137545 RepID=A0A380D9X4_9GAMM|nr:Uncharacterised protein [Serratia quinivorans]SUJ86270.1 Uncharacterised protein [Serratia quinivorans]